MSAIGDPPLQLIKMDPLVPSRPQCTDFLSLDRDIRDIIYNMVLHSGNYTECLYPECSTRHDHRPTYLDSTNLLLTCRQIYREAVDLLHKEEVVVQVAGPVRTYQHSALTGTVFRHPKAFGKPKIFAETRNVCKRWLSFGLSELEFVRLRKIALILPLPHPCPFEDQRRQFLRTSRSGETEWSSQEIKTYHNKLKDVARALRKCTHLKTVRLLVNRNRSGGSSTVKMKTLMDKDRLRGTTKLLMNIIRAADAAGAVISIGRHQIFNAVDSSHDAEPLVPWLLQGALQEGIFIEREQDPQKDWMLRYEEYCQRRLQAALATGPVRTSSEFKFAPLTGEAIPKPKVSSTDLVYGMHQKDLLGVTEDAPDFQLLPECRKCYAIFAQRADLEKHLQENLSHQIPFMPKAYNMINENLWKGCWRMCPICGQCFMDFEDWKEHIDENDHDRATVVPRWTEDNEWWETQYKVLSKAGQLELMGTRVA